jgi:hypothetical protein
VRSRHFWTAALLIHFAFIAVVSCCDIFDVVAAGQTALPQPIANLARHATEVLESLSPRQLSRRNPVRQTVIGYAHLSGVESPYTFFAPNVPESLRVVFEIHHPDNRITYDVPHVQSHTEGLRLSALVDQAARQPGLWRDVVLQMLAAAAADRNPDATQIQVVVAALRFPRPIDYLTGSQPTYDLVCSYNFEADNARQSDETK